MPVNAGSFAEALRMGAEIFHASGVSQARWPLDWCRRRGSFRTRRTSRRSTSCWITPPPVFGGQRRGSPRSGRERAMDRRRPVLPKSGARSVEQMAASGKTGCTVSDRVHRILRRRLDRLGHARLGLRVARRRRHRHQPGDSPRGIDEHVANAILSSSIKSHCVGNARRASWRVTPAMRRSSRTAPARPRTLPSPISPSAGGRADHRFGEPHDRVCDNQCCASRSPARTRRCGRAPSANPLTI